MQTKETHPAATGIRKRITVEGVVQGVGFRPFVYGLAHRYGLTGEVSNTSSGVIIEIQGPPSVVDQFERSLVNEAPPLSVIERVESEALEPLNHEESEFVILHSVSDPTQNTLISSDVSICDECLAEMWDPADRRYRYPFINCTNCGPRFTIIQDIPYDRPLTTMAGFEMCPSCQAEYDDPLSRRFHAQPIACPDCGPRPWIEWSGTATALDVDGRLFDEVRAGLFAGEIWAIKGLGGFHLACNAFSDPALASLRARKGRALKPFAVMVADLETAKSIAFVSDEEAALLESRERPIVLLRKRPDTRLSSLIAPGNEMVGVMLPYTPLHALILEGMPVLVMTSGNISGEPIIIENEDARKRLGLIADRFLMHDRPIHNRCDDAVVRSVPFAEADEPKLLPIRRSRGYAPFPVRLPEDVPPVLAVGGELKATFCLTQGRYAYMSQHIGDMENWETLQAFESAVERMTHLFRVNPERIACDLHPSYLSTGWAEKFAGQRPLVKVQHHHAHVASIMAEHRLSGEEPVIGVIFDGTGYGTDGTIWGGEVLVTDYKGFERAFHLETVPLAGGDASVKRPYRMALAHLYAAGIPWSEELPAVQACPPAEQILLRQQLEKGINQVETSSFGRLFDAVAALVGGRTMVTYEGQAAIELEALADPAEKGAYAFGINDGRIQAAPLMRMIASDVQRGVPLATLAARFHNGVADCIVEVCRRMRTETGLNQVALSGGVFQNVTLLTRVVGQLEAADFRPLIHSQVPPNDGGLALGQAMIAAHADLD